MPPKIEMGDGLSKRDVMKAEKAIEFVGKAVRAAPGPPQKGKLGPVREFYMELTYRCDQKCVMCDVWRRYRRSPELEEKELSSEEIKKFVSASRYLSDLQLAVLTGGEPFLRADLAEISGFFLGNFPGLKLILLTSAFNTELILERLREIEQRWGSARLQLGSSLDGIGKTHNRIRGCRGAFAALERTLDSVQSEFPQISLSLNFTITPRNFREMEAAFQFARNRGADFSAQFPVPWKGTTNFAWKEKERQELRRIIRAVVQELIDDEESEREADIFLRDPAFLSKIYYWQGLLEYEKKPQRLFDSCKAGRECAMFSPQGDLYLCPPFKYETLGNVREQPFDELWESPAVNEFRSRIERGDCHCWLNCMIYSLAETIFQDHREEGT
jgi:MoaA/NifB/PqqE/SkfB family radical SAM enzyme